MLLQDFFKPTDIVALVGNATPDADLSAEIDACDVVLRMSKAEHYATGLVGNKIDLFVIQANGDLLRRNTNWHLLGQAKHVFYRRNFTLMQVKARAFGVEFSPLVIPSAYSNMMTTGAVVYGIIREFHPDEQIKLFGYTKDRAQLPYFKGYDSQAEIAIFKDKLNARNNSM